MKVSLSLNLIFLNRSRRFAVVWCQTFTSCLYVTCRSFVRLCWRQDGRSCGLWGRPGVLGALEGPCETCEDVVCWWLAGLQSTTLERSDSTLMDWHHSTSWLLRLQRRQHTQSLLRVRHTWQHPLIHKRHSLYSTSFHYLMCIDHVTCKLDAHVNPKVDLFRSFSILSYCSACR